MTLNMDMPSLHSKKAITSKKSSNYNQSNGLVFDVS